MEHFTWCRHNISHKIKKFDINNILSLAQYKELIPDDITSREDSSVKSIPTYTVDGNMIREKLLWLFDLYENDILDYANKCLDKRVYTAKNDIYAVNINIQKGLNMRYECHVDSNPLQGLLYLTTHSSGGELVISKNKDARNVNEVDNDCLLINPVFGELHLFDLQCHPHYVRPLNTEEDIRLAVTMNFYTDDSPESNRPDTLSNHLFI